MYQETSSRLNACKPTKSYSITELALHMLRFILLVICIYSCTRFAQNPNQSSLPHMYTDYHYAMFTNVVAYSTIFVSLTGIIYRTKGAMRNIYNTILPVILSFELFITVIFWLCFFIYPSVIAYPKYLKAPYKTPLLTELGVHLFPFCLLYLEQLSFRIVKSRFHNFFLFGFLALYLMMICCFRLILGKFPYPILNKLSLPFLCIVAGGMCLVCYTIFVTYMRLKKRRYFSSKKPKDLILATMAISALILVITARHSHLDILPLVYQTKLPEYLSSDGNFTETVRTTTFLK